MHTTYFFKKKLGFLEFMIYILLCQTHRQTDMVKPPVAKGSNVTNGECAIFF